MRLVYYSLLAGCLLLGIACNTAKQSAPMLEGTKWQLTAYTNAEGKFILPTGETALLTFESASKLGGYTGCNSFGGDYTLKEGKIQSTVFSTKRYCNEVADQEQTIVSVLSAGAKVQQPQGRLILTAGKEELVYEPYQEKIIGDPIGMVSPEEYMSKEEAEKAARRYTGMLTYFADAGSFTDCVDGQTYSVALGEGAWLACEQALQRMKKGANEPALVVVDGMLVKNTEPEGREYLLKITRFVTGDADGSCP